MFADTRPLWWLAIGAAVVAAPRIIGAIGQRLRIASLMFGQSRRREVDLDRAAAYHRYLAPSLTTDTDTAIVDDRTWADLDLDEVFTAIDHTSSEPGRQALYHALRTPATDAETLQRREAIMSELTDPRLTAQARAALARLEDRRAAYLVELLFGELPRKPLFWWCFPILTLSSIALVAIAMTGVWPPAIIVFIALCVVNVVTQVAFRPRVKQFIPALQEIPRFLNASIALSSISMATLSNERQQLRDGARALGTLRRTTWWLQFEPGQTNELAASIYEYINLALLLDVNAFVFALNALERHRAEMRGMFAAIGMFDVAVSTNAWRATLPRWTRPVVTTEPKRLEVDALTHPLVSDAVPNAVTLAGSGVLITGSNMTGKSTFVRALGLGAILGQSLNTVCATAWRGPLLHVRTSIGRADSVTEGKSYYLAEAESVLGLVRASEQTAPHLFLLDEIFRGTNTIERVAAGAAVLSYLNRGPHLTVVATHDIELLDLLGQRYAPYHFREHVVDGVLRFDYRLYAGPSSTRNAIALLEVLKYPPALVADALAAVAAVGVRVAM